MSVKVSIIVTAHNYGRWLAQSLDSALAQNYRDFEVVVVDDGSTDDTPAVLKGYSDHPRITIVTTEGVGLAAACNRGIDAAAGRYLVRLDADDFLDENMLAVLANYLDLHDDVGLVFCAYYNVDEDGNLIDLERRAKIDGGKDLLDRPAQGAGAMFRRDGYDAVGGYDERLRYQEDYDFWIRFIEKFAVANVTVPLMCRRRHGTSMSTNQEGRMAARRDLKRRFAAENRAVPDVIALVPAPGNRAGGENIPLMNFEGRSLLARCLANLDATDAVARTFVVTEDDGIAAQADHVGAAVLRTPQPPDPALHGAWVARALAECGAGADDVAVIIDPGSPFLRKDHVAEAVDTLLIYDADVVVAVSPETGSVLSPVPNGLAPVREDPPGVQDEANILYRQAPGLVAAKVAHLLDAGTRGDTKTAHIEISSLEALRVDGDIAHLFGCLGGTASPVGGAHAQQGKK